MNLQEILKRLSPLLTDDQIAKEVGVSGSVICRLRNGVHKSTSYEKGKAIEKIALREGVLKKIPASPDGGQ